MQAPMLGCWGQALEVLSLHWSFHTLYKAVVGDCLDTTRKPPTDTCEHSYL